MKEYKKGESYSFKVLNMIMKNDGNKYFILSDGERDTYSVKPYDFQLDSDYELPREMVCDVTGFNMRDLPYLCQNKTEVLKELYPDDHGVHKKEIFTIVSKKSDGNNPYLLLKDMYGIPHRFYLKDSSDYEIGSEIELIIKGLKIQDNGKSFLQLEIPKPRKHFSLDDYRASHTSKNIMSTSYPFGVEDLHTEFKTSIVFPASKSGVQSVADIDRQMSVILTEIAAFMNAEGGKLYIGVKDDGQTITGIEGDYEYLSSSSTDTYKYYVEGKTLEQKEDQYQNKIRNNVARYIGASAGNKLDFEFRGDARRICIITISPSDKPVYYNGMLFQRQHSRCQQYKQDEINNFVLDKLKGDVLEKYLENRYGYDDAAQVEDEAQQDVSNADQDTAVVSIPTFDEADDDRDHELWHKLTFFTDGSWTFDNKDRNAGSKAVLHTIDIEKYQKAEHQFLLMIYDNGRVNSVDLSATDVFAKRGFGVSGWNTTYGHLKQIVCAERHDMLAIICKKGDEEFINVRDVLEISNHQLNAAGNLMITGECSEPQIFHIPSSFRPHFTQLINKANPGLPIFGNKKQKSIKRLLKVISELYPMES